MLRDLKEKGGGSQAYFQHVHAPLPNGHGRLISFVPLSITSSFSSQSLQPNKQGVTHLTPWPGSMAVQMASWIFCPQQGSHEADDTGVCNVAKDCFTGMLNGRRSSGFKLDSVDESDVTPLTSD